MCRKRWRIKMSSSASDILVRYLWDSGIAWLEIRNLHNTWSCHPITLSPVSLGLQSFFDFWDQNLILQLFFFLENFSSWWNHKHSFHLWNWFKMTSTNCNDFLWEPYVPRLPWWCHQTRLGSNLWTFFFLENHKIRRISKPNSSTDHVDFLILLKCLSSSSSSSPLYVRVSNARLLWRIV